jgi:hypothetical protein
MFGISEEIYLKNSLKIPTGFHPSTNIEQIHSEYASIYYTANQPFNSGKKVNLQL